MGFPITDYCAICGHTIDPDDERVDAGGHESAHVDCVEDLEDPKCDD